MSYHTVRQWVVALAFTAMAAASAQGNGLIVIHPWEPPKDSRHVPIPIPRLTPLEIKYHRVDTEITDNIGITKIDQVFHNPNARQLEGTYIFPLADDVSIQKFSMFMNGKQVNGELLDRDKAGQIYQSIVNKSRDPALLEYIGTRMYRARVFPIPANGEVRIQLEYSQTIEAIGGLATYRYPLSMEKSASIPLSDISIRVRIKSQLPIATVFCPSHGASVDRKGANEATVGYEEKTVRPDKDFVVAWQTTNNEFGLALMTYHEAGEDGFFMARIVPSFANDKQRVLPKDISFVIDTSGSMSGSKIEQARQALKFCLQNLNADDRFNIIAFSTEARPWRDELVPANEKNVNEARDYVSGLQATGGTAINDALLTALRQAPSAVKDKRPYMVVFITDGMPTIGEQDIDAILKNVRKANSASARLFVFGVGNDVNTKLLDKAAEDNHGARQYVSEKENLELVLSNFYGMIANPVLGDINVTFGSPDAYDVYPRTLPDLFKGSELVVFGRYRAKGSQNIVLTGKRGDVVVKHEWKRDFLESRTAQDFLPRLWANRKIAFLLDEMRMNGENAELKAEIVLLAKRYGILTPYTSFLVVEESELRGTAANSPPPSEAVSLALNLVNRDKLGGSARHRAIYDEQTGQAAVGTSFQLGQMKARQEADSVERQVTHYMYAGQASTKQSDVDTNSTSKIAEAQPPIRFVGSKTFYRKGDQWIDSAYDELAASQSGAKSAPIVKIRLFSTEYYHLLSSHREAGRYFAIGSRVIVVLGQQAYETIE